MPKIVAISYREETLAGRAAEEVARCRAELGLHPDAAATIVCERDGSCQLTTSRGPESNAAWSEFWSTVLGEVRPVPGTSVLLLALPPATRARALEILSPYGGEVISFTPGRTMRPPRVRPGVAGQH